MHGDILWLSMHIPSENTINSYAWEQLVVSMHITGENTVISYAWVHLVIVYACYW